MISFALSKEIEFYLRQGGWMSNRETDISPFTTILEEEGYFVSEASQEFLKQFGGLVLNQPAFKILNELEKLHFDPILICEHVYRERVETYEERVEEPLVVIGEAYNEQLILMMSPSGKIYGGYDDYLTILGDNYDEAFEALYHPKDTPEIG
ncbi:SUKH-3 domain-containing protein [Bacillus sp. NPDC077411]|uniref:SUKH-3 domain-containing protein n=1 Tax=Bacillus sp. NPDC077411 TaxID=3363947 RepID=UPI0037C829B9